MGKFCGMCGYKMQENEYLCTNCGFKVTNEVYKEKREAEIVPQETAFNNESEGSEKLISENLESNELIRRKKPAVAIVPVILVVLIVLWCSFFLLFKFLRINSAIVPDEDRVIKNEYGEFIATKGGLMNLDCPEEGYVKVRVGLEEIESNIFDYYWVAEDQIYSFHYDSKGPVIYRCNFESKTEIKAVEWMDSYKLCVKSDIFENEMTSVPMWNLQYSDGFLYFIKSLEKEDRKRDLFVGKLYRVDIKNKEIECVDNNTLISSYIVDGNRMYFTGICGDESGVFSMKPDSGKKKLIYEISEKDLCHKIWWGGTKYPAYNVLCLYNNRLYLDVPLEDGHKLISISKNGKNEKTVISKSFFGFKIDLGSNTAYYGIENADGTFTMYVISLSNFKREKLFEINGVEVSAYAYKDNKLYFLTVNYIFSDNPSAIIYNLNEKRAMGIYYEAGEWYADKVDDYIDIE